MRNPGLDLLRFLAVALVILRHLEVPDGWSPPLDVFRRGGWVGVDIFFVLSGFLVSSLLFVEHDRTGKLDVTWFLIRRGFKIYPAFWVFIAFSVLALVLGNNELPRRSLFAELFFVQNYVSGIWNHTWSLAVEEHFYIALAALFAYLVRSNPKQPFSRCPQIFLVVAAICLMLRLLTPYIFPQFSYRRYLVGTHLRVDSLAFGALIAYAWHLKNLRGLTGRIPTPVLLLTGAILLAPAFFVPLETRWFTTYGFVLFYLGGGFLLLGALRLEHADSAPVRLLAALGAASYSTYLWHVAVMTWGYARVAPLFGVENYVAYIAFSVIGAFAVGFAMTVLVESPLLSLRDRWFPSRLKQQNAAVAANTVCAPDAYGGSMKDSAGRDDWS